MYVSNKTNAHSDKPKLASTDALRLQLTTWLYQIKGLSEIELNVLSVLCEEAADHTGDEIPPYECVMRMAALATLSGITDLVEVRLVTARLVAAGHVKVEARVVPDELRYEVFPGCDFRRLTQRERPGVAA